ncbi:MAG: universal stress protein [Bacteroidota bacterium]|mgnify:CR=1 FL=1|nr:universal stress protein [Bacteroidota bacterium]
MHRIIVPVDFSETSLNAARFTAKMLAGKEDALILLYHNYAHDSDFETSKKRIEDLQAELRENGAVTIEYEMEKGGDLVDHLDRLAHTRRATLIAMGLTGQSVIERKFIGSHALKMVDRSIYPVMIIPPDASFNEIRNVAFASDFKDVENSTPSVLIGSVLDLFGPKLHIVNIDPEHYVSITEEKQEQKEKLITLFAQYEKEFYFIGMNDFHDAIHTFLSDYKIDMLITIPRHHSGTSSFWQSSNTRKLAYHSHIPILTAHQ